MPSDAQRCPAEDAPEIGKARIVDGALLNTGNWACIYDIYNFIYIYIFNCIFVYIYTFERFELKVVRL